MAAALNKHQNLEIFSSYLYLSMAFRADHMGLKGIAHWLHMQVREELVHVEKFSSYLLDQGQEVVLDAIEKPQAEFKSALDIYESALEHEKLITAKVNDLVTLASEERDHATVGMLQWFVTEQVEEEATFGDIVQKLKLIGSDGSGLFMLDKELSARPLPALAQGA